MKTQDYKDKLAKYLNKEMDQDEIVIFEQLLKEDPQLHNEFLIEKSIYSVIRESGRERIRNRFAKLEMERSLIDISPEKTEFQVRNEWIAKAAFMHQADNSSSSLPVSDDTLKDFLSGEDED